MRRDTTIIEKLKQCKEEKIMRECKKCGCTIYGLGDDYFCPVCQEEYCYNCIKKHGCNVETKSVGNKHNYVEEK